MSWGQLEWLRRKIQPGFDSIYAHVTETKDAILNLIAGNTTHIVNYVVSSKADILNQMNQGVVTLNSFPKITGVLYTSTRSSAGVGYTGAGWCVIRLLNGYGSGRLTIDGVDAGIFYMSSGSNPGIIPFSSSIHISSTNNDTSVSITLIFVQPPPLIGWFKQVLPTLERRYLHGLVAV